MLSFFFRLSAIVVFSLIRPSVNAFNLGLPSRVHKRTNNAHHSTSTSMSSISPMDMKQWRKSDFRKDTKTILAVWLMQQFTQIGRRPCPSSTKSQHIRLLAITVSPYVEKVRWILDLLESNPQSNYYYTEECHPPGICAYYTTHASNDQASQSPMIVKECSNSNSENGQQVLWGSDAILQNLCSFGEEEGSESPLGYLYPREIEAQVRVLEQDLGLRLGASVRCLAYNSLLLPKHYHAATQVITNHCPLIEKWIYKLLVYSGEVPQRMDELLKTRDSQVIKNARRNLRDVFEEMSKRLIKAQGSSESDDVYLMDTPDQKYGLTAVDIAFASLSSPLICPPETQPLNMPSKDMPSAMQNFHNELLATTAGQHALKVYRRHRPVDPASGVISIRSVNQNRFPLWKAVAIVPLVMLVMKLFLSRMMAIFTG